MMLGIYEIAPRPLAWDIPNMASNPDRKENAQRSALEIADRLLGLKGDVSERQWTIEAEVSPSFFSNLRGTPTKPPSDPSVDQLRRVLRARDVTLPEFFFPEAQGRLARMPTRQVAEKAIADALKEMPAKKADQPRYLLQAVQALLRLPATLPPTQDGEDHQAEADPEEATPPRSATNSK